MTTQRCILTGREVDVKNYDTATFYKLKIAETEVEIFICRKCDYDISVSKLPKAVIEGIIANGLIPRRVFFVGENHVESHGHPSESTSINVPSYFDTIRYPITPSEKMNDFLNFLSKKQKYDGESVKINLNDESTWIHGYFKHAEECKVYLDALIEEGLIHDYMLIHEGEKRTAKLTIKGLNKLVELETKGVNSKSCFIAMKFDDSMLPARDAIKRAIKITGFEKYVIDEEHLKSDKTIPDAILKGIKKSKFCIADFTKHNNGVYFESGYALGLGKPVIYVCHESEFNESHFDIKQLQHIIYKSPEDLEKKLIDKIEAWIK